MDIVAIIRRVEAAGGKISWDSAHADGLGGHVATIQHGDNRYQSDAHVLIEDAAREALERAGLAPGGSAPVVADAAPEAAPDAPEVADDEPADEADEQ